MLENEFEKQVQQSMDKFNLNPSAEVWTEVERRIRKEKKRRFIFWWFFLFLLAGGGIATGIWLNNKKESKISIVSGDDKKEKIQHSVPADNNKQSISAEANKVDDPDSYRDETDSNGNKEKIKYKPELEMIKKRGNENIISVPLQNKTIQSLLLNREQKNRTNSTENSITVIQKNKTDDNEPEVLTSNNFIPENSEKERLMKTELVKLEEPANEIKNTDQEITKQTKDSVNILTKNKQVKKQSKKWDWGVTFSAGRSAIAKGPSFFNKSLYADALSQQNSSPGSGMNTGSSLIRPSFSWSAGLFAKKPLSKRLDLNMGIGYSYLSTIFNTGSRVDSVRNINNSSSGITRVESFYRPSGSGNTNAYTNRHHFISLSGNISWQIIQGKKFKLYWENGLSYDRLLGSSMLHYNYNLPGYYKDNSLLTKNHFTISTGFSIPVSQRVIINPFASYSLTPVLKNSDSSKAKFTNLGIRLKILFKNKN